MRQLSIALLIIGITASFACAGGTPALTIHASGYGPVNIGTTVAQASLALGEPIRRIKAAHPFEEDCHYEYPNGDDTSLGLMVIGGVITRIDVWDSSITTNSGLTVGAKEEEIQKKFKSKVIVEEHEYLGPGGHYVTVNLFGGNQLLFETAAKKVTEVSNGDLKGEDFRVTSFRVGRPDSVSLIEGCF